MTTRKSNSRCLHVLVICGFRVELVTNKENKTKASRPNFFKFGCCELSSLALLYFSLFVSNGKIIDSDDVHICFCLFVFTTDLKIEEMLKNLR